MLFELLILGLYIQLSYQNTTDCLLRYIDFLSHSWGLDILYCYLNDIVCYNYFDSDSLLNCYRWKKFCLRQPNFSLYKRERFFLDDAVSCKSVWPHTYRLTTIWYTNTQHWQAKLAVCTPVCKGLDPPLPIAILQPFYFYLFQLTVVYTMFKTAKAYLTISNSR